MHRIRVFAGKFRLVTMAMAMALLVGCEESKSPKGSDSDDNGGTGQTDTTGGLSSEQIDALATAWSTFFVDCLYGPDSFLGDSGFRERFDPNYPAPSTPSKADTKAAMLAMITSMASNERIEVKVEQYDACLDGINALTAACGEGDFPAQGGAEVTECQALFAGTRVVGETCGDSECEPGSSCGMDGDTDCGVCVADAALGESCELADCADGLECEYSSTGEDWQAICIEEEDDSQIPEAPEVGTACTSEGYECGWPTNAGLYCQITSGDSGTCQNVTIVDEGGDCDMFGTAGMLCHYGLTTHYCKTSVDGLDAETGIWMGVCTARASLGETCSDEKCNALEAYCDSDSNQCMAVVTAGGACSPEEQQCVLGLACDDDSETCVDAGADELDFGTADANCE